MIEAMKQALEALEAAAFSFRNVDAITTLRTAIEQAEKCQRDNPLGGPAKVFDAMANSIRAGDDYHQVLRQYGFVEAAEKQGPVALETVYETIIHWDEDGGKRSRRELARRIVDLYTTPPAAPVIDKSAAIRIATALGWTPPVAPVQEPYGYVSTHTSGLMHFNKTFYGVYTDTATEIVAVYTTPPAAPVQVPNKIRHSEQCVAAGFQVCDCGAESAAPVQEPEVDLRTRWPMNGWKENKLAAQRQWVGLTDEEMQSVDDIAFTGTGMRVMRAIEAKLREKNT